MMLHYTAVRLCCAGQSSVEDGEAGLQRSAVAGRWRGDPGETHVIGRQ